MRYDHLCGATNQWRDGRREDCQSCAPIPVSPSLEAAFRAGYDNGEGDGIAAHVDGYDVPGVEKHLADYMAALRGEGVDHGL
jgi:hypothetical protein